MTQCRRVRKGAQRGAARARGRRAWLNVPMTDRRAPRRPLLIYVVKQLELATRAHLDRTLSGSGVTALQYTALSVLARESEMTAADLARASFVRAQSAADLVGALESRGLIERHVDAKNRRRMLISLTPRGEGLLEEFDPVVEGLDEKMLAGLDANERAEFRRVLAQCRRSLGALST